MFLSSLRAPIGQALLALLFSLAGATEAAADPANSGAAAQAARPPIRDREVAADAPSISYIDSPDVTCYRALELARACYVEWRYVYVSAGPSQYILDLSIEIDGRLRANAHGFFQTELYLPASLYGPGFLVSCGQPGSGGEPGLGRQYSYTIRASETGGLSSANYGTVLCPATRYIFVDGFVAGNASAWSALAP